MQLERTVRTALFVFGLSVSVSSGFAQANTAEIQGIDGNGFHVSGRASGDSKLDRGQERAPRLALWIRAKECVSFDCTRIAVGKNEPDNVSIESASLWVECADGRSRLVPHAFKSIDAIEDAEIETFCPSAPPDDRRFWELGYLMNKWELLAMHAKVESATEQSMNAKVMVGLDIYVFRNGRREKAGTIMSEPFFVKITEDSFEFSKFSFD